LFDALSAVVPAHASVWEPGCGSGQATRDLSVRFAQVFATDPSAAQVGQHWATEPHTSSNANAGNVTVAVEPGEATSLPSDSIGLVAVAQALHWFDRTRFFAECDRVLHKGGVLAAWTYQDMVFSDDLEPAADAFRRQIEPYWPIERADVDAGYAHYAWPFEALEAPVIWLSAQWTLPHLLGYLGSLSASARCRNATGRDPVADHAPELRAAWGDADLQRTMRWPLVVHLRQKAE
jgi:SAM-dependent methyltransferase